MEILLNILVASVILSLLLLIIIYHLLDDYDIETKEYVRLFLYILLTISLCVANYKKFIEKQYAYKPVTAAAEVFDEIQDSQQLNGIMSLNGISGGMDELIIDNIPNSITLL